MCFGGAGGQHACDVADLLDMDTVLVHPMSGLLSAWGIDKAAVRALREDAVERPLDDDCLTQLTRQLETLQISAEAELAAQGLACATRTLTALIRYEGSDTALPVAYGALGDMQTTFQTAHRQQFGFVYEDRQLIVEALTIECVSAEAKTKTPSMETPKVDASLAKDVISDTLFVNGAWQDAERWPRYALEVDAPVLGPAIIAEDHATTRGHVFSGDDALRARAIEMLLCDFSLDLTSLALEFPDQSLATIHELIDDVRERFHE